jgi:hypothetical protein
MEALAAALQGLGLGPDEERLQRFYDAVAAPLSYLRPADAAALAAAAAVSAAAAVKTVAEVARRLDPAVDFLTAEELQRFVDRTFPAFARMTDDELGAVESALRRAYIEPL